MYLLPRVVALIALLTISLTTYAEDGSRLKIMEWTDGVFVSVEMECVGTTSPAPVFGNDMGTARFQCKEMEPVYDQVIRILSNKGLRPLSEESFESGRDIASHVKMRVVSNDPQTVFIACYVSHPYYDESEVRGEIRVSEIDTELVKKTEALCQEAKKISDA